MEGKNLFLIDDDPDDVEIFEYALKTIDPTVHLFTAIDGEDALQKLSIVTPDLIFLDLNMPKVNGMQCLVELRKMKHLDSTPIIIYTTSGDSADKDKTLHLGATCFFTKPAEFDILRRSLKYIMLKMQSAV